MRTKTRTGNEAQRPYSRGVADWAAAAVIVFGSVSQGCRFTRQENYPHFGIHGTVWLSARTIFLGGGSFLCYCTASTRKALLGSALEATTTSAFAAVSSGSENEPRATGVWVSSTVTGRCGRGPGRLGYCPLPQIDVSVWVDEDKQPVHFPPAPARRAVP